MAVLRHELRAHAEATAGALAGLLLDTLAALFPALCARHGPAEARAVVGALLPGLRWSPRSWCARALRRRPRWPRRSHESLPDESGRVRVVTDPAMGPGDVRLRWHAGTAARDGAALWEEVAAALAPAGLLSARTREVAHVE